MTSLRVVVVDDQPLARERLRSLLDAIPDIVCVGEAADGHTAVQLIDSERPDIAFLDIQLPGASGLDVVRRMTARPLVIYTTAYDRHAVTAFELHAVDYLLKPFRGPRLERAVERAREFLELRSADSYRRMEDAAADDDRTLSRIFVRRPGRIVPVPVASIEHLEADGDYVKVWSGDRSDLVRVALTDLLERLDPDRFVRVHRSHAINLDHVSAFRNHDASRLEAVLESGHRVVASRTRTPELRARFSI